MWQFVSADRSKAKRKVLLKWKVGKEQSSSVRYDQLESTQMQALLARNLFGAQHNVLLLITVRNVVSRPSNQRRKKSMKEAQERLFLAIVWSKLSNVWALHLGAYTEDLYRVNEAWPVSAVVTVDYIVDGFFFTIKKRNGKVREYRFTSEDKEEFVNTLMQKCKQQSQHMPIAASPEGAAAAKQEQGNEKPDAVRVEGIRELVLTEEEARLEKLLVKQLEEGVPVEQLVSKVESDLRRMELENIEELIRLEPVLTSID